MAESPSNCQARVSVSPSAAWITLVSAVLISRNIEECIDLEYMRATENNPVGLYSCAGLGNTGAADKGINWPLVDVTDDA